MVVILNGVLYIERKQNQTTEVSYTSEVWAAISKPVKINHEDTQARRRVDCLRPASRGSLLTLALAAQVQVSVDAVPAHHPNDYALRGGKLDSLLRFGRKFLLELGQAFLNLRQSAPGFESGYLAQARIFIGTVRALGQMGRGLWEASWRIAPGDLELDVSGQDRLELLTIYFGFGGRVNPLQPVGEVYTVQSCAPLG